MKGRSRVLYGPALELPFGMMTPPQRFDIVSRPTGLPKTEERYEGSGESATTLTVQPLRTFLLVTYSTTMKNNEMIL